MTKEEVLEALKALGNDKTYAQNAKRGAGDNQFGVRLGDIRKIAKKIKTDHALALALWETEIIDARFLATLIVKPNQLSAEEIDGMVRGVEFDRVADWLNSYVVKKHPQNEALRLQWMAADDPMAARAGWNLTYLRFPKKSEGLDIDGLLDRIETEMGVAHPLAQWTMNFTLTAIGIHHPEHRDRALAIGESIGLYQDWPEVKGCTSPYAPIWINEMVARQAK